MFIIALKMLIGDRTKYYGLIFGVAFATLLMAQQISIFLGLMTRVANPIYAIPEVDLWVMDPRVRYLEEVEPMRDIELSRVKGIEGVEWAGPFYKGQAVRLTQDISNIDITNSTNIVITPITYTPSTLSITSPISPFNMLGIATNTASGGTSCTVCTKGITTVQCTSNITTDFTLNTSITSGNVGVPGVVGKDGFIFNNTRPYPTVMYIKAGYFLESGNNVANNGNYTLFYVDPIVQIP
jgi:hypothetical protein